MMLGEWSTAGAYWQSVGEEAVRRGVKGLVFMGAHWEVGGEGVEIASNPGAANVVKQPVAWVEPSKYINYEVSIAPLPELTFAELSADLPYSQINASPELAGRVKDLLDDAGIESKLNPTVEWSETSN